MDDEGIRAAFHDAVATLDPPVERLVAGAMARGRRRTLVVRAGAGLSVAAVLGGAAVLVVALLPGAAAHRSSAIGPGGPSSGSAPSVNTGPAIKSPAARADTVTMTPQALLQTALDTLPRDGATSGYAGNFDDNAFVGVQFVFDDGNGAAQVDIALQSPPKHVTPHAPDPIIGCRPASEGCTVLADGARASTRESLEYPYGHDPNSTERSVDLVRTDGVKVSIIEWNAPKSKDAPISRAHPPFTLAELIAWADRPEWQVQITPHRADAAAGLFTPVDLREPPGEH